MKLDNKNNQTIIEENKIVIHDNFMHGPRLLRTVEIINPLGERKTYKIIKTKYNKYLFN